MRASYPPRRRSLQATFQPYDPPEVMNAEQAGHFLQIDEAVPAADVLYDDYLDELKREGLI